MPFLNFNHRHRSLQQFLIFLQLLGDVPEEEDAEDAELQASIASANKWRKIAALTRQRAAEVHRII